MDIEDVDTEGYFPRIRDIMLPGSGLATFGYTLRAQLDPELNPLNFFQRTLHLPVTPHLFDWYISNFTVGLTLSSIIDGGINYLSHCIFKEKTRDKIGIVSPIFSGIISSAMLYAYEAAQNSAAIDQMDVKYQTVGAFIPLGVVVMTQLYKSYKNRRNESQVNSTSQGLDL